MSETETVGVMIVMHQTLRWITLPTVQRKKYSVSRVENKDTLKAHVGV